MGHDWKSLIASEVVRSGRSMRSISKKAGLSPNYLRMVLKCGRKPSIENLSAIATALDVPLHKLLPEPNASTRVGTTSLGVAS